MDLRFVLFSHHPRTDMPSSQHSLDAFPRDTWLDPLPVHLSFNAMVGYGIFLLFVALVFWFLSWRKKLMGRLSSTRPPAPSLPRWTRIPSTWSCCAVMATPGLPLALSTTLTLSNLSMLD